MRTSCVKNGLVMVVILLFVGVAVQPAVAVNPISSDNEEDCSICSKVSKLQNVEKYRELSDRITTLSKMNKELNPDRDYPRICDILLILLIPFVFMRDGIFSPIFEKLEEYSLSWWLMYPIVCFFAVIDLTFFFLIVKLNCIEFPPW